MALDINAQIDGWMKLLLDTSGRNRLISTKFGPQAALEILHPSARAAFAAVQEGGTGFAFALKRDLLGDDADALGDDNEEADDESGEREGPVDSDDATCRFLQSPCLGGDALTGLTDERLGSRLNRLRETAREALEERGVNVLHLAFGFLRWNESEVSSTPLESPLILVPVSLDRAKVAGKWRVLPLEGGAERNECLAERLKADFRFELPELLEADESAEPFARIKPFFDELRERLAKWPDRRWELSDGKVALGTFDSRKLPMWKDLDKNRDRIAAHPICRAIAGDETATANDPDVRELSPERLDDEVPVADALHVLPADSSQHAAIEAVRRGVSLILEGPPGSGKSQTIANIIADRLAAGKKVLFVSEKAAALEVVLARLRERNLSDFCLSLHDPATIKRAEVCKEFVRTLDLKPTSTNAPTDRQQRQQERRGRLNEYVRKLHLVRTPLGQSLYAAFGRHAHLTARVTPSQLRIPDAATWDAARLDRARNALAHLTEAAVVFDDPDRHPWRGCRSERLTEVLRDDLRFHLTRLSAGLPEASGVAGELAAMGWLPTQATWSEYQSGFEEAGLALAVPLLRPEWLTAAAGDALRQLPAACEEHWSAAAGVPEFDIPAACDDAELPVAPDEPAPLRCLHAESIRGRLANCREALAAAVEVRSRCRSLAAALELLVERTALDWMSFTVAELVDALARFRPVASACPLPETWGTAEGRARRKDVLDCGHQALTRAESLRAELPRALSPRTFHPDSADLVSRASRYCTFPRSLVYQWSAVRHEWAALYATDPPTKDQFREHVGRLVQFHRLHRVIANLATDFPDCPTDDLTTRRWRTECERLDGAIAYADGTPPLPLAPVLFDPSTGAAALTAATDRAADALTALRTAWAKLAGRVITDTPELDGLPTKCVADLSAGADAWVQRLDAESAMLERCVRRLQPGADLALDALADRLDNLRRAVALRNEIDRLRGACAPSMPLNAALARDWRSDAEASAQGHAYLARRSTPSDNDRRALTDGQYRAGLQRLCDEASAIAERGLAESWAFVTTDLFSDLHPVSTGIVLGRAGLAELAQWCAARLQDCDRVNEWLTYRRVRLEADAAGVGGVIGEVRRGQFRLDQAADAFESRFLAEWLDAQRTADPGFDTFQFDRHEERLAEFVADDKALIEGASAEVRSELLNPKDKKRPTADPRTWTNTGVSTLKAEAAKKSSRKKLRKLFAEIPDTLLCLKPCWMMSPLAVSTYLDSAKFQFDLVIFDEASQVRPHDAICAIYRGTQLVVAGDPKQLPPTSVGVKNVADGADGSLSDHESILGLLAARLPSKFLRWHYRSRREDLILFSNRMFYQNRLVTFPSPDDKGERPIRFVHVPDGRFVGEKNDVEASRVVDLVVEHFDTHPSESLGVIAFGQNQQQAIRDRLETLRRRRPDLDEYFGSNGDKRFFVKNVENVQGDERDRIIFSVGYGKNDAGKLANYFGTLNNAGGERRLNVAITRARLGMTVVSSMHPSEMRVEDSRNDGPRLLKAYLEYAERGPSALPRVVTAVGGEHQSPFEVAVAEKLRERGIVTTAQVGCAGYSIDLAVVDPSRPGRFLLGIECDGATYHRAATARDRDRLRQEVLEGLGWTILRVWSTDWFRNQVSQVDRIVQKVNELRRPPKPPEPPPDSKHNGKPRPRPTPAHSLRRPGENVSRSAGGRR